MCGVSECDREASIMRRPWPTRDCCSMRKINNPQILLRSDDIVTKYFFLVFSVMENRWNKIDTGKPKYSG